MNELKDFLATIKTGRLATSVLAGGEKVDANYREFRRYCAGAHRRVYGVNTLPGHRDDHEVAAGEQVSFQYDLIENHAIGGPPFHDARAARCITLAKVYATARPGALVSGGLFRRMAAAAVADDFRPEVPIHASYSAGDVIPAAHWARALLGWIQLHDPYTLLPGEGMALVNGAFVHVGLAAALVFDLRQMWTRLLCAARASLEVAGHDVGLERYFQHGADDWYDQSLAYLYSGSHARRGAVQPAVSIRAVPQVVNALCEAVRQYCGVLDDALSHASGNPMFDAQLSDAPVENGSFLDPCLTIAASGLAEALLLNGWASVQRAKFVLSGQSIARTKDAATASDPIGLVQWPKLAQAKLERMRVACGTRAFVSGGATSLGVEDLWSHGVETTVNVARALSLLQEILAIELYCACAVLELADEPHPFDETKLRGAKAVRLNETEVFRMAAKAAANARDCPDFLL
ncbi:aromatic amino acid lyase [Breoghania sp.]|uniref:aromatic amino acid lyase n=1 Tax=Breoghania sp. TaxID=2065378 RepID=UPI002AA6E7AA|nr:aromatic amino acid lyase [Breoghania sp.]